eukprot:TRINITY_DN2463_c0_g1_i1.p1 TRINITY_DN2463_c0_g1~~TRINITY_DN2463_c0_g1_i1.p1  ORF type:complete len:399 (-),score=78.97 TRINITY_DN2463_c0_g1_i1:201-1397(-)
MSVSISSSLASSPSILQSPSLSLSLVGSLSSSVLPVTPTPNSPSPSSSEPPAPPLSGFAINPYALTLAIIYGVLSIPILFQIARILYNRHNVWSFQFSFLAINFCWAILRMVFWILAQSPTETAWGMTILYWIPFNLQFATFCLLVLFYASVVHKNKWQVYRRIYFAVFWIASTLLLIMTTVWYWIFEDLDPSVRTDHEDTEDISQYIDFALWICLVFAIVYYSWRLAMKIWKTGVIPGPLQVQGISQHMLIGLNIFIALIFFARSILNLLSSILGPLQNLRIYHDRHNLTWIGFLVFALWDVTPTIIVLFLFRRIPTIGNTQAKPIPTSYGSFGPKTLFENPQRYDIDEDEDEDEEGNTPMMTPRPPAFSPPFDSPFAMRFDGSFHMPGGYKMNSIN